MKKPFLFILMLMMHNLGFTQNNPVQQLSFSQSYSNMQNYFVLSWQEPETPHNELLGYNIYRGNDLYRFQNTSEFGLKCNPDFGQNADCDFLYYQNGGAFTAYVVAVYAGNIESTYTPKEIGGVALRVSNSEKKSFAIFQNPVKDNLNFSQEISNIKITDLSGKIIKQISNSEKSINVSKLVKGTYIITATSKSGELINKKFIKE